MRARHIHVVALLVGLSLLTIAPRRAFSQEQAPSSQAQPDQHLGPAGELAKEHREATGDDEEENANLKHSSMVQKFAKATGMSVHAAHLVALGFNFALVIFLIYWFSRKSLPQMWRNRTDAIRRALDEARTASQEANARLAQVEARLQKLDSEISEMKATAEKEAASEEERIRKAAEEDMAKVVATADQEIVAAAKQARRELAVFTADLATSLARQQIRVDPETDQVLVKNFAKQLSNGGKDGH